MSRAKKPDSFESAKQFMVLKIRITTFGKTWFPNE